MKRRKNFFSADVLLILLGTLCLALAVLLVFAKPEYLIVAIIILAAATIVVFVFLHRIRHVLRKMLNGKAALEDGKTSGLATLSVPIVAVSDDAVIWYNDAFKEQMAGGEDNLLLPLAKLVPKLELAQAMLPQGQNVKIGEMLYTAYGNTMQADKNLFFVVFIENTELKTQAAEYMASRPSVIYFLIDTYDEILKEMKESERAAIMSQIDLALEEFVGKSSGFLCRVTAAKYIAVVEERHIEEMVNGRFSVLDDVRKADDDSSVVTLSIGAGRLGRSLKACDEMAQQALDMALGRGGDQAAVKSPDGYEFYGGVARSVEKRTKVKSRIVATAIKDLMANYNRVLIMGHRDSDMDCIGAATGMMRFCKICKKPAAIVINEQKTLAAPMLAHLKKNGYAADFLSPDEALPLAGDKTLLVIVDTHMKFLLESEDIYNNCGAVVVIDHHRKMVGYIDNSVIFYHEPYASSASELVTELLQYIGDGKDDKPTPAEAEALLAGIMLDTRTFSLHVGVRTFEAAAWLRRAGAQTAAVKKLFSSPLNDYLYRSHLVSEAKISHGCAVVLSDKVPQECEVVAPQAANELLTIEGVDASFVGVLIDGVVRVSARSMGEINVQIIMEKIGGGGHLTMAGAQLKGKSLEEAGKMLLDAIDEYIIERGQPAKSSK